MLLLRRRFYNLSGQEIELDIDHFTNCLQVMVTRKHPPFHRWPLTGLVVLLILRSLSFFLFAQSHKTIDLLFATCFILLTIMVFISWRSPVYRETIALLNNLSGIEVTRDFSFFGIRWKRSQFILTKDIIMNEAITMHRVIYYLVAIPLSMNSLLSYDPNNCKDGTSRSAKSSRIRDKVINTPSSLRVHRLIPLFSDTCPRVDCLKLIYRHIYMFKVNVRCSSNRANLKPNQKSNNSTFIEPNDISKASISSDKSLAHRRNGYKQIVH